MITKQDLIISLSNQLNITQKQARLCIETFLNDVTDHLSKGDVVRLVGFGDFMVKRRKARSILHPKTGAELHLGETNSVGFTAGKTLTDKLKGESS